MLIKLRIISLLFILLLSTSAFGQNNVPSPLQELQQDLFAINNLVNNNEWWICPVVGATPELLPRQECIQKYIAILKANSTTPLDRNIILKLKKDLREFSDENKRRTRNIFIPQLKEQIKNHPDNPDNPIWDEDF